MKTLLSFTSELLKQMINKSDWTIQTYAFAKQKWMIAALSPTVMHTDVDTNVTGNVMTQQQPVCLHLLNGSAVTVFSVGAAESITLPLMWTHSVLPFFHVGHAGNKLTVAWLPAPWPSQVNHLALLCNTDHYNHHCVAFTMFLKSWDVNWEIHHWCQLVVDQLKSQTVQVLHKRFVLVTCFCSTPSM